MPVFATTVLPDVTGLSGDASIEDEITLSWTDVTDYGNYHIQHRVSGSGNAYTDDGTVSEATATKTITGLLDGEKYDFRVRSETEHVTGAWLETSPVTLLPAPSSVSATAPDGQQVDLSWVDNADNEDTHVVDRREQVDGSYGTYEQIASKAANTTAHTDGNVHPNSTFQYRLSATTEHVTAAGSPEPSVTTPDSGSYHSSAIPPQGWYVEVDHPASGRTLRPTVVGTPRRIPTVNDLPELYIPVQKDENWSDSAFDDAPMRVWYDGEKQPVDELEAVTQEPGRTLLEGRGGLELLAHVEAEYESKPIHDAARELVANNTSYTTDVSAPTSSVDDQGVVQDATTNNEFSQALASAIPATTPLEIQNNNLELLQSCWTMEAEDSVNGSYNQTFNSIYSGSTDASGNAPAIELQNGTDYAYWDFTPTYNIPEADVGLHIRQYTPGTETPEIVYKLGVAGNALQEVDRLPYSGSMARLGSLAWRDMAEGTFGGNGWTGGDLQAGKTYRLRLDVATAANDPLTVDAVAPADNRYTYTFDDTVTSTTAGNALDGPELYPDVQSLQFDDYVSAYTVVEGSVTGSFNDTTGTQQVALSNNYGNNWTVANNVSTLSHQFTIDGPGLRFRVKLGRYGSQASTPRNGISGQKLHDFSMSAKIDTTPLLVNESHTGEIRDILQEFAEKGNMVWEYTPENDGTFRWTKLGDITGSRAVNLDDYEMRKSRQRVIDTANIYGTSQFVREETFTANVGSAVGLLNDNLQSGSEIVWDPSTGTEYVRTSDYEVSYNNGTITALSGGSMTDGSDYNISYRYNPFGTYTDTQVDGRTLERTVPSLNTGRACEQVATTLVNELQKPNYQGMAIVPVSEIGWSVIENITIPGVDGVDTDLHLRRVEYLPNQTVLYLGTRQTADELVNQINQRYDQAADRL